MGNMVKDFLEILKKYEKEEIIDMDYDLKALNKIYNDNKPILNLKELKPDKAKN